jgi:hypothetical protein
VIAWLASLFLAFCAGYALCALLVMAGREDN